MFPYEVQEISISFCYDKAPEVCTFYKLLRLSLESLMDGFGFKLRYQMFDKENVFLNIIWYGFIIKGNGYL